MNSKSPELKLLREFLEGPNSTHLSTRNASLTPQGTRVWGISVLEDGKTVETYLPHFAAEAILADLKSNGEVALLACRASSNRTLQIKGRFLKSFKLPDSEKPRLEKYWKGFVEDLNIIGVPNEFFAGVEIWPCVAVQIEARDLFHQTPGPGTGERL